MNELPLLNINDFVSCGYFIAKTATDYRKSDFLADRLVTVSTCVTETLPDSWAIEWVLKEQGEAIRMAEKWGINGSEVPRLVRWTTEAINRGLIGWPNVFASYDASQEFLREFPPVVSDWQLLGISLHREDAERFLRVTEPPQSQPGYAPNGEMGVRGIARQEDAPHPGGVVAGFDVLGVEISGTFHSWLCNSLEEDASKRFNITPTKDGLLAKYTEAKQLADYADIGGAEPVPWFPFLVISYSEKR
jgi:hypothetical protein